MQDRCLKSKSPDSEISDDIFRSMQGDSVKNNALH